MREIRRSPLETAMRPSTPNARSRRGAALSLALCLAFASPIKAEPQSPPSASPLDRAPAPSFEDATVAVAADSDRKTRDDYEVLKLAAMHLPNERYRIEAAWSAANGRWVDAARNFKLAARYADKYSQHRLSLLYWHGVGVERDPVEAYVWADLAAERGYPHFLAVREKMWAELSPAQQAAVPARGNAIYQEYGDPVAKRRLRDVLGHAKRRITGSHTGFVGFLDVSAPLKNGLLPNLFENAAAASIYRPERIDPDRYWAIEDIVWKEGRVKVGDFEATSLRPAPVATPKPDAEADRQADREPKP